MAKFTKGPWECTAAEFKGKGIVAYEIKMPHPIISKANAELIAAAPCMYEALQAILRWYDVDSSEFNREMAIAATRKSLSKADGQ